MSEQPTAYDCGFEYDLAFDDYQSREGLNGSLIVHGRKSMLHMKHANDTPEKQTAAMSLGTAAHYLLLEGSRQFVQCSARRGSSEWKDAILAAGDERFVLKPDEYTDIHRMRDVAMKDSDIAWIVNNSRHEVAAFWDGKYGRAKGRIDILGNTFFADYKTTNDATPSAFFRVSENMGYHLKMGWYAEGLDALKYPVSNVLIIVQEQSAPYDCGVIEIPASIIETGRAKAVDIAMQWKIAQTLGTYQGMYSGRIQYERPGYATYNEEQDVSTGEITADQL